MAQVKLNLGAGSTELDGYTPIDIKDGQQAYPLPFDADYADEIYASHILEHFEHGTIADVLMDWKRALKPGGTLRISVPDLDVLVSQYNQDNPYALPLQAYIFGGQTDEHDYHKCAFNKENLTAILKHCGFQRIEHFEPICDDCSRLPISLNLQAKKPVGAFIPKVAAVMSVPRLGFMDNYFCSFQALSPRDISMRKFTGAFWGQCLERVIGMCLEEDAPDYILTIDYDTVFDGQDVDELIYLMQSYPEYDAIAPVQVGRGTINTPLMTTRDESGELVTSVAIQPWLDNDVIPVDTAHFGLTMIRAGVFRELAHPWFDSKPNEDGLWEDGRVDDDIHFWYKMRDAGMRLGMATRIPIGHMELMVRWAGKDMSAIYQTLDEWTESHNPPKTGLEMNVRLSDWSAVTSVAPVKEPVTSAEFKSYIRLDGTAEDTYIAGLITAARLLVEQLTNRKIITQTVQVLFDRMPFGAGNIDIPFPAVQSVTSVAYRDTAGDAATETGYTLRAGNHNMFAALQEPTSGWPSTDDEPQAWTLTYVVGYGDDPSDVPESLRQAIMQIAAGWYEHRELITSLPLNAVPWQAGIVIEQYKMRYNDGH